MRKVRVEPSHPEAVELEAIRGGEGPPSIDTLQIPPGVLCVVNALAGEVWLAQGYPQRRWLVHMDADARAASEP